MNTWVITLIVVVVVGIGLVALTLATQARKRRETSGGIGLPPIGAMSGEEPLPGAQAPGSQPDGSQTREPEHHTHGR